MLLAEKIECGVNAQLAEVSKLLFFCGFHATVLSSQIEHLAAQLAECGLGPIFIARVRVRKR